MGNSKNQKNKNSKIQFEKNAKFSHITSAMFNAFSISTLKFEKIKYFWKIQKSEKIKINKMLEKKVCHY